MPQQGNAGRPTRQAKVQAQAKIAEIEGGRSAKRRAANPGIKAFFDTAKRQDQEPAAANEPHDAGLAAGLAARHNTKPVLGQAKAAGQNERAANIERNAGAANPAARAVEDVAADDPLHNDASDTPDPIPQKVQVGNSPTFITEKRLGKGGFGQVFLGTRAVARRTRTQDPNGSNQVAIKFEHKSSKGCAHGHPHEWTVYSQLGDTYGIPKLHHKGQQDNFYIMVMDLLGPSLWDVWNKSNQHLDESFVACIAIEALHILQQVHAKGFVHGDIKPENFLLGASQLGQDKNLFLVDLGLAVRWRDKHGEHVKYDQRPDDFRGTIRYASVHAHLGRTTSRRDDLESLAYTLCFLLNGRLPWQGYQGENKGFWVCKRKMGTSCEQLCRYNKSPFREFAEMVVNLKFEAEPEYQRYIALFQPLVAPMQRSLDISRAIVQVGQKRQREDTAADLPVQKKVRVGLAAQQWITVYNKCPAMKQRYHYNVTTARLLVHVQKGWEENLFISSVACCQNMWGIVMDAGTAFTQQIYKVHSASFLPKEWIMEKWEEGYYITAVAGSDNQSSLVVMSKGSRFTQQSYKVSDNFPYEWIKKKWREGFHVTAMATAGSQWAVVMSRNAGYSEQVVELDFQYPSEGIHKRWDDGFRITSCAATHDQAAFVLSIPKKRPVDETQETLRTTTFPTTHVKEKWDRDLYITCMAYGKTTS